MSTSSDNLDATISQFIQRQDLTESQRNELILLLLKKAKQQVTTLHEQVTQMDRRIVQLEQEAIVLSSADADALQSIQASVDSMLLVDGRVVALEKSIKNINQKERSARNYVHATWATLCAIGTVLAWMFSAGILSINAG